jgi:hypothetical protein
MGYVETILEPGERVTYRAHLHWIIYVRAVVLMLVGLALTGFALIALQGFAAFVGVIAGLAVTLSGIFAIL